MGSECQVGSESKTQKKVGSGYKTNTGLFGIHNTSAIMEATIGRKAMVKAEV
jgi:hypothetical protein